MRGHSTRWHNRKRWRLALVAALLAGSALGDAADPPRELSVRPRPLSADASVAYDYDIVYVRAPRRAGGKEIRWAEFGNPTSMELGADLMLLHPDGREEMLVSGSDGSVMDPYVSFDGEWVYYSRFTDAQHRGADIYRIHVPSRRIVKLTDQTFTPNTGAADWSKLELRLDGR